MQKMKKISAVIVAFVLVISMLPIMSHKMDISAAEITIISPTNNELKAAGYIDITWNEATSKPVKEYQVYIDDVLEIATTETTYEFYTTKVKTYDVYIKVVFQDGTTVDSEKITFGVTKKGLGLATDMGANINLKELGCGWYYNWGTSPSSGSQYSGIEYVPMVWKETDANNFRTRVENFKNQGYKYVLTFNEPDLGGQCDMPMEDVYNVWQGIEGMEGIKISSPVTALWPNASPDWFQAFMTKVDENGDYQPDFISIHCYPDDWAGASMAEWFLETVVDWTWETYGLPIWITEFSTTGQWVTATGNNGTKEFWEAVMPGLDEREYVERYAAFGFNSESTGLWLYSTGELTPAGEIYKTLGNPEGLEKDDSQEDTTPEQSGENEETSENESEEETTVNTPLNSGVTFSERMELLPDSITSDNITYTDYIKTDGVSISATSKTDSASNAIDENIGSRWESEHGVDPQSITIDLGQIRNIKKLGIIWETASAKTYNISVSNDDENYESVCNVECDIYQNHRLDEIILDEMVTGRYVQITGTSRITGYGYSIFDMAIYGTEVSIEEEKTEIEVVGYQVNTDYEGSRVVAMVEPTINNKNVNKWGLVFGLSSYNGNITGITDEDLFVDNTNEYIASYESTSNGTLTEQYGDSTTATYYSRTMAFGQKNYIAFTAEYKVRAYALLEDGTYVYSDISEFTVYDIADRLYSGNKFATLESHEYAYNTILTLVNPDYKKVEYGWSNTVIK